MCCLERKLSPMGTARARVILLSENQNSFVALAGNHCILIKLVALAILATCADKVNSLPNLVWKFHHYQIIPNYRDNRDWYKQQRLLRMPLILDHLLLLS